MRMMTDIRFKLHFRPALLMMAAVAVLLLPVSCRDHDVYVENVIGMSVFQTGTRALVNSADDMGSQSVSSGHGFGVYGYKTKSGNNTQIFTNQEVTATESGTNSYTWSYIPLKYWDMSAEYHYVAYWPYRNTGSGASHDNDTHILTLSGIPNWQPSASGDDWLIATSSGLATSYFHRDNYTDGMVYFTFSHLLAQLEVEAWYYGNEERHATITDLTLGDGSHKVPSESGTVSYEEDYSTPSGSMGAVTTADNKVILSSNTTSLVAFSTDEDDGSIDYLKEQTAGVTPVPDVLCSWLVVPFSQTDIPLEVSYKIGDTPMSPVTVSTSLSDIEPGKKYILRLKINTKTNQLNLAELWVKDWDDVEVNKEVYNW